MTQKFLLCLIAFSLTVPAFAEEKAASPEAKAPATETKGEAKAPTDSKAPAEASTDANFTGEAKVVKEYIEQLFEASKYVNNPPEKKAAARAKMDSALDWATVAQTCLGKAQWAKQSPANREAFQKLLREVIVKTAYSRMDTFWDSTKYTFQKIDIQKNTATVLSRFLVKDSNFELAYYLNKKGNQWKVIDISYEGERYSENISQQIAMFLKEKPFNQLLDKLKKRRDELDEDSADKKKKS